MIGRIIAAAFQFRFMVLAIDVIDRRDPSNEMRRQLQPNKTNLYTAAKDVLATNETKRFGFKSGCVVRVENGEMRRHL